MLQSCATFKNKRTRQSNTYFYTHPYYYFIASLRVKKLKGRKIKYACAEGARARVSSSGHMTQMRSELYGVCNM